jgi:hypothetical protein
MKVIYVAGKYRASNAWLIEDNIRVAEAYALAIWKTGLAAAICPHAMCRYYQGAAHEDVWASGTMELMRRCDAVFVVPGYNKSVGTMNEINEAISRDMPIFYSFENLCHWLAKEINKN